MAMPLTSRGTLSAAVHIAHQHCCTTPLLLLLLL
jgi:hypothetical protein